MGQAEDYARVQQFWKKENLGRPLRVVAIGGGAPSAFFGPAAWFPALKAMTMFQIVGGNVSRHSEVASEFAERYFLDKGRIYATTEKLIEGEKNRPDGADLAVIVTPTAYHARDATLLAEAGIPMICEKPMTHEPESARKLVDVAYKNRVRIAVAYTQSTSPMGILATEKSLEGELGPWKRVAGQYFQGWMGTDIPEGQGGHRQQQSRLLPENTGDSNVTADLGTHILDFLRQVGQGGEVAGVDAHLSSSRGRDKKAGIASDDSSIIYVKFTNGAEGVIHTDNAWPNRRNFMVVDVSFEHGSIRYEGENSDNLAIEISGKPTQVFHSNANEPLPDSVRMQSFMPSGHEGSAYDYKLKAIAASLGEAVVADILHLDPACLKRPYRTALDGLMGVQFVNLAVKNNGKGLVPNHFLEANKTLPVDNQRIGVYARR